ncbi:hypothetical protein ISR94_01870 [Candidatus Microgenomates bacterium]|nr:hypothetical protein [Candidatus Microgenomates bacterium]
MKQEKNDCYNPGDLSLPKDYIIIPREKVLIIQSNQAMLTNPRGFDRIESLDLETYSREDEKQAIAETTI